MSKDPKRILIYGDSLTWGRIPQKTDRLDPTDRFTGVLQNKLGKDFIVVEEGLRGRMAKGENPHFPYRDGYQQFPGIFLSHLPLHLLIIFLGVNDTNTVSQKSPEQIADDLESYITLTQDFSKSLDFPTPKILFVSPPHIQEKFLGEETAFIGGEEKSKSLAAFIEKMTKENQVDFFDSASVVTTCEEDGVHLSRKENQKLGEALAQKVTSVIG